MYKRKLTFFSSTTLSACLAKLGTVFGAKNLTVSGETVVLVAVVGGRFSNLVSIVCRSYILAVSESSLNERLAGGLAEEFGLLLSSSSNSTPSTSTSSPTEDKTCDCMLWSSSTIMGLAAKSSSSREMRSLRWLLCSSCSGDVVWKDERRIRNH